MLTRCIPWPELASRVIFLRKTLQFWKNQNNTWKWRVEVSKQGMEMKIQTTVNYLNTLARNIECKETQAQKPPAQLWPHQQARVPGSPKICCLRGVPGTGSCRALLGRRRVPPAAGMKSRTTPAQTAQRVDRREGAMRSQAGFDGNLLCCPVLKSFGRYVRTGLFFRNYWVPAKKCVFNRINISAQKLWPDSQRSTVC